MRIELTGFECPVMPGITVGVQRGRDVVDEHPADGDDLTWRFEAQLLQGPDLRGPYVHGKPGARFFYLSWSRSIVYGSWARPTDGRFRRAKLMIDAIPADVLIAAEDTALRGRFGLTMADGSPLCAAVRPPAVEWTAG
jgi:hypothetical protein